MSSKFTHQSLQFIIGSLALVDGLQSKKMDWDSITAVNYLVKDNHCWEHVIAIVILDAIVNTIGRIYMNV